MTHKKTFLTITTFACFAIFLYVFYISNLPPNIIQQTVYGSGEYQFELNIENVPKNSYLVKTSKCQIVHWPPFDEQVIPLYQNKSGDQVRCKSKQDLDISVERHEFTGIQIKKSNKKVECFSSIVNRSATSDDKINYLPSVELKDEVKYFPENNVVRITCLINEGKEGYEKVIPLIPEKRPKRPLDKELPNILFIGLDSISRGNFDRHFPITTKLLNKYKFYTMYGYNKVADNTFVNLTPLLTGHYLEDIWNETMSKSVFLNYFPFIWKDYENKGYQTLLMEDAPKIATFNYLKPGFLEPPTTYYLRPFSLSIEPHIKNNCYLDKPEIETYYEYIYDFLRAMDSRKQSYFAFTFMARLMHDELNKAGLCDPMVANLFDKLFNENLLSNTILIFFSDHGIRFGPIRETLAGKLEERLPFMHLYLPEKWRNNNLKINENRLTTPFDIHATLAHIIRGEPNHHLRYGKSLLEEIPEDRSCKSIPILDHWCACQSSEPIKDTQIINPISSFIVKNLNALISQKYSEQCVQLKLYKTISAYEQHLSDKVLKFKHSLNDVIGRHVVYNNNSVTENIKHYLITLRVQPSNASFEATVKLNRSTGKMSLIGEVSRINLYGNQSICIDNQFMRRYCFCKNQLQTK